MAREQFANLPVTTLNGAINNSTTTVVVTDGSKMPLANFRIIIEQEIMFVISRSSNTLTVIRAIESTSVASHADTLAVAGVITKGAFDQIRLDILASAGIVPRWTSLSADDDEFDDESFSGWTKVWHGTNGPVTEVEQDHQVSLSMATGSASAQLAAYLKSKTPSAGDYMTMGFSMFGPGGQFPIMGVIFADGTTYGSGSQVLLGYSGNEQLLSMKPFTGFNSSGSPTNAATLFHPVNSVIHIKVVYQGSNTWDAYLSVDGIQWAKTHNGISITLTPTKMGFFITTWGSTLPHVFNVKYVRFSF